MVVTGNWEDYTGSGIVKTPLQPGQANILQDSLESIQARLYLGEKNIMGDNKSTNRLRQREEYFEIKSYNTYYYVYK